MCKKNFGIKNSCVYLLFAANAIYACYNHDFNWLFWLALILTAICLVLDIWKVCTHGRS